MGYIIPVIIVTFIAGGFWEVLFAVIRKHEINMPNTAGFKTILVNELLFFSELTFLYSFPTN